MRNLDPNIEKTIDADGNLIITISEKDLDNLFEAAAVNCDFLVAIIVQLEREISNKTNFEPTDPSFGLMFRVQDKQQLLSLMKKVAFRNFRIVPE